MILSRIVKKVIHRIQVTRKVDFEPDIWDKVITINRKDTYDIKLSKRRIQYTGRCAAQTGASAGGGGCHAAGARQKDAAHGSGPRRQDCGPESPGEGPSRIYPGIQGRSGEAPGRQRAQERHHSRAERGHRRPQVPAGDANQLRSGRRRITNRALRGPSPGHRSKQQASSDKPQATSSKRACKASSPKQQASSSKPQAARSRTWLPS